MDLIVIIHLDESVHPYGPNSYHPTLNCIHPLYGLQPFTNILVIPSFTDGSVHFMDFRTPHPPRMKHPFYWTSLQAIHLLGLIFSPSQDEPSTRILVILHGWIRPLYGFQNTSSSQDELSILLDFVIGRLLVGLNIFTLLG